jgi:hypothetical protein
VTDYLNLPRKARTPAPGFEDCYERDGDSYRLTADAITFIGKCKREIEQITKQAEEDLQAAKAEEQRLRATAKSYRAKSALREALIASGCQGRLLNAAIAQLSREWTFTLEPSGEVLADNGSGPGFLKAMVELWLASDDGEAFGKRAPSSGGHFADLIRKLK